MNKIINLFIISISFLVIVSLCGCNHTENKVNEINDVKYSTSVRSAQMIISNIEVSYSNAVLLNYGSYPTIKQVSEQFSMNNVVMNDNGIIECQDSNINCVTSTSENNLSVLCRAYDKEFSTSSSMILSSNNS